MILPSWTLWALRGPTLWQRYLCRWRSYHTWRDGRCIVCGIGIYGDQS